MHAKEKALRLIELLADTPDGLHITVILRKVPFGCKRSFYRSLGIARELHGATIECVNKKYCLRHFSGDPQTLAETSDDEIIALATIQHILARMTAGALEALFGPLRTRIDRYLAKRDTKTVQWTDRIKILDSHYRNIPEGLFGELLQVVARRRAVGFRYADARGRVSGRTVSPQQIVRYKDNWYLDAWCHDSNALRIFSLDGISDLRFANVKFTKVPETQLEKIYATSYGIFSGECTETAVIRFTGLAAKYARRETWHPEQKTTVRPDGSVLMELPFNKSPELVKEILSRGAEAEVVRPAALRREVAGAIEKAFALYRK